MGLSFAIPIELALDVVDQLKQSGRVSRGWLGVLIQDVTRDLAESFGMNRPSGALIAQVMPDSPADKAGLQVGDIVIAYENEDVETSAALPPLVGRSRIGEKVQLKIIRDGKPRQVDVTLEELPEQDQAAATEHGRRAPKTSQDLLGITVDELTEERQRALGIETEGVLVVEVRDGPGREAGLMQGDIIRTIDGKSVGTPAELNQLVSSLPAGKSVPLLIVRNGSPRFLALRLP